MRKTQLTIALTFSALSLISSVKAQHDSLYSIIEQELNFEITELSKVKEAPYYISYRVHDIQSHQFNSIFGSLIRSDMDRGRILVTEVRVGDYHFDNTHPVTNEEFDFPEMNFFGSPQALPIENNRIAIAQQIWRSTQSAYQMARQQYEATRSQPIKSENAVDDFSKVSPTRYHEPIAPKLLSPNDSLELIGKVKRYSGLFDSLPDVIDGQAIISVLQERRYFLSSEGTRVVQNQTAIYLIIRSSIRAIDGDVVPHNLLIYARNLSELPTDEEIGSRVKAMIEKLEKLKTAPLAEPYTGPAILQARAAAVFFHEIFGHRVEGHRLRIKTDGQTFKDKINERVLPHGVDIVFDPTRRDFNNVPLHGHYLYDDEGVQAQGVKVVENGFLKRFLMSRTPNEAFNQSNGHGRAQAGVNVVTRQSNMIVTNHKPVPTSQLRKMLLQECARQRKPYGYLFVDVEGGFTNTQRFVPNAFNIFPTEVYRVYVDGRPDELVRGVDLIGTPLAMFAEVKATDDQPEVFTGFCGAESGSVPVTAVSPSLLVNRIETQRKMTMQVEKPLVQKPGKKQ